MDNKKTPYKRVDIVSLKLVKENGNELETINIEAQDIDSLKMD